MKKSQAKGNFISEWFGQRIYPEVKLDSKAISGANWGNCPFLSSVKREKTGCIKNENAFGVCTINSVAPVGRLDWLVCPYRVIDSEIVREGCSTIFAAPISTRPIPISILGDQKGLAILDQTLESDSRAFVFFQDKLGGEISINGTTSSPEMAFDVTVVELTRDKGTGLKIGRYGFIEIQTMDFHGSYMDFHGSYRVAVSNLRDANRLHKGKFPKELSRNQAWAAEDIEGPNIANVFKRTFYQMLLKFELSREGVAAGTVLALPESVWESWQPFLGRPQIEQVSGSEFRIIGSDNSGYHGTNGWIFVFDLDETAPGPISPVRIKSRIRVSATDLVEHAFVTVPGNMLHAATTDDVLLNRIRDRVRRTIRTIPVE